MEAHPTFPDTRVTPTAPELEIAAQRQWRLLPQYAGLTQFDQLLHNEFLDAEQQHIGQQAALARMLGFAIAHVPYYRELCRREHLDARAVLEPGGIARLPVLTRQTLQTETARLRPHALPGNDRLGGTTNTSGTTGQPVSVQHTIHSMLMFPLLAQREARWFRFDPMQLCAQLRPSTDLPKRADGSRLEQGDSLRSDHWPLLGKFFNTGAGAAMSNLNPAEIQLRWLADTRPAYLIGLSSDLEHLALAYSGDGGLDGLRACQAISQQMTASMRRLIERKLGVPVYEDYGLNEVGLVAARCPEAGRYHVHAEHCFVEIVNDSGQPCRPGETGRVLVTSLSNTAMPLIRYDADDLAEPGDGPCPCGRSLPSVAGLHGRYRRRAQLPPDTWPRWERLARVFEDLPPELHHSVQRYQLHQYRDGRFELRLVIRGELPAALTERLESSWQEAARIEGSERLLAIRVVDDIPRPRGGKFQNFTSDFTPPDEPAPAPPYAED